MRYPTKALDRRKELTEGNGPGGLLKEDWMTSLPMLLLTGKIHLNLPEVQVNSKKQPAKSPPMTTTVPRIPIRITTGQEI